MVLVWFNYLIGGTLIRILKILNSGLGVYLSRFNKYKFFYNKTCNNKIKTTLTANTSTTISFISFWEKVDKQSNLLILFSVYLGSKGKNLYALKIYFAGMNKDEAFKR